MGKKLQQEKKQINPRCKKHYQNFKDFFDKFSIRWYKI